jgi:DEAD/DEAH box helicase domain-containing protein
LILYDSSGKSGGVCAKAFDNISDLLAQAADCIAACPCIEGCPSCTSHYSSEEQRLTRTNAGIASSVCSGANAIVSKLGARIVLDSILGRDIDVDSIPLQEPLAGAVPGGSIDLGDLASVRPGAARGAARGVMESEEMEVAEREERARVLSELMGGFIR